MLIYYSLIDEVLKFIERQMFIEKAPVEQPRAKKE
jgi:hypothetical protein